MYTENINWDYLNCIYLIQLHEMCRFNKLNSSPWETPSIMTNSPITASMSPQRSAAFWQTLFSIKHAHKRRDCSLSDPLQRREEEELLANSHLSSSFMNITKKMKALKGWRWNLEMVSEASCVKNNCTTPRNGNNVSW